MKKTKLRLKEYLADYKITVLATHMDMTYTQLYKYFKDGVMIKWDGYVQR